jgi:hypothetical protein
MVQCFPAIRAYTFQVWADWQPRGLSDIAARDEAKVALPDARLQARKYWRCIRWNTLRTFSGLE